MNSKMISEFVNVLLQKKKCSLSSLKNKTLQRTYFLLFFFLYMLVNLFCLKPLIMPYSTLSTLPKPALYPLISTKIPI